MAQNLAQLTDQWMVNPTMFDPTQASNQFSNYNNAALPWPPTYNPGLQGGPVNAATGQPIQSFQQWQQQNPGGLSINSTAAAPAAQPPQVPQYIYAPGGQISGGATARNMGVSDGNVPGQYIVNPAYVQQQQRAAAAPQAAPQAGGPPNNWQAAINSLANPGTPAIQGANVPMVTGSQPAGGVNQAFLQQAGAGQGMNQNFLSALAAIQGRPQQGVSGGAAMPGATGAMGGGGGMMPPPSGGVPGTAFSQPLQQGGTPSWQLGSGANVGNGNSLAGYGNTPAGSNPFANLPAFAAAQQKLLGR